MRRNIAAENESKKEMFYKILKLKEKGFTVLLIKEKLGLTNKEYSFYKSYKTPEKMLILKSKRKIQTEKIRKLPHFRLKARIGHFLTRSFCDQKFTYLDVIKKFGENPVCALTGKAINYDIGSTYNLDHIIPVSRGGSSNLDNLQLLNPLANRLKGSIYMEDVILTCKEITQYYDKQKRATPKKPSKKSHKTKSN